MTKLNEKLHAAVEAYVARRLGTIEADIAEIFNENLSRFVDKMTAVIFGIEKTGWGDVRVGSNFFISHPVGMRLSAAAEQRARDLVDEITKKKSSVSDKDMKAYAAVWEKEYKSRLASRIEALIRERAGSYANDEVEKILTLVLTRTLADVE